MPGSFIFSQVDAEKIDNVLKNQTYFQVCNILLDCRINLLTINQPIKLLKLNPEPF